VDEGLAVPAAAGRIPTLAKSARVGQPSITVSALSRDTCRLRGVGFDFPFVERFWFGCCVWCCFLFFAHRPRLASRILRWKLGSTSHLFGHLLPTMIRDSDSPTFWGGKAPNHSNDELLRHQAAPRAALHANQLRITGLATQHPVHPYRQLAGDGDLSHATAPAQLESLIVLP